MTVSTWINGISGRMGRAIYSSMTSKSDYFSFLGGSSSKELWAKDGKVSAFDASSFAAGISEAKLIIDFSTPAANLSLLNALHQQRDVSILIGTTGISQEQLNAWSAFATRNASRILFAPNTSIGILVFRKALKLVSPVFLNNHFDCEIIESHHRNKIDSPSGTALTLAHAIQSTTSDRELCIGREGQRKEKEIGISSIRGGNVIGEHIVQFLGDQEEFQITHRALDRKLFASGALRLAKWLSKQPSGAFDLDSVDLNEI